MAVCAMVEIPGGTQEMYEAMIRRVGIDGPNGRLPDGLLHHYAGATEGGWTVVTLWQSLEAYERFFGQTVKPAAAQMPGGGSMNVRTFTVFREFHADDQRQTNARAA